MTWVDHLVMTVMIMAIACAALKISIMTHPRRIDNRPRDALRVERYGVINGELYAYRNGQLVRVARLGDHRSGFLPIFLPAWLWAGVGRGVLWSLVSAVSVLALLGVLDPILATVLLGVWFGVRFGRKRMISGKQA